MTNQPERGTKLSKLLSARRSIGRVAACSSKSLRRRKKPKRSGLREGRYGGGDRSRIKPNQTIPSNRQVKKIGVRFQGPTRRTRGPATRSRPRAERAVVMRSSEGKVRLHRGAPRVARRPRQAWAIACVRGPLCEARLDYRMGPRGWAQAY